MWYPRLCSIQIKWIGDPDPDTGSIGRRTTAVSATSDSVSSILFRSEPIPTHHSMITLLPLTGAMGASDGKVGYFTVLVCIKQRKLHVQNKSKNWWNDVSKPPSLAVACRGRVLVRFGRRRLGDTDTTLRTTKNGSPSQIQSHKMAPIQVRPNLYLHTAQPWWYLHLQSSL